MKKSKKPLKFKPAKSKPTTRKPPASQPKPAAIAATAAPHPEPKTVDSIRIETLEHRITRFLRAGLARVDFRINSLEKRVNGICHDLKQIYYLLGQIEEGTGQRLRWRDRVTDAEKSETQ